MIDLKQLGKSLGNAVRGIVLVFQTEQSFRLQISAAILVLVAGWFFKISHSEWLIIFVLIGAVLSFELLNSVFERIIDVFKPRLHPAVRDMKDIMAGCVLVASLAAVVIGLYIFIPRLQIFLYPFRF